VAELKKKILDEGHNTSHSIHPGGNKLYKHLKQRFWWSNRGGGGLSCEVLNLPKGKD